MSKQTNLKPVATALGAAFAGGMLLGGSAQAADNPFGLAELDRGYMQVASSHMEGKCGGAEAGSEKTTEGKCGEGKCGGDKAASEKTMEGKCGGDKAASEKTTEGKCGEGKCGGSK